MVGHLCPRVLVCMMRQELLVSTESHKSDLMSKGGAEMEATEFKLALTILGSTSLTAGWLCGSSK